MAPLELPPISLGLESGPAISGGPTESGNSATGDFIVNKAAHRKTGLLATAAVILPILSIGGIAWLLIRNK